MGNSKFAHEFLRFFTAPATEGEAVPSGGGDSGVGGCQGGDVGSDGCQEGESTPGEEALGDPGKRALDAMKQARNEARQQAREVQAELDALKAQVERREAKHAAQLEEQ